jgi:hypothetical protein
VFEFFVDSLYDDLAFYDFFFFDFTLQESLCIENISDYEGADGQLFLYSFFNVKIFSSTLSLPASLARF